MFAYLCLGTSDLPRSIRFYDPVMAARELALWICPFFDKLAAVCRGFTERRDP